MSLRSSSGAVSDPSTLIAVMEGAVQQQEALLLEQLQAKKKALLHNNSNSNINTSSYHTRQAAIRELEETEERLLRSREANASPHVSGIKVLASANSSGVGPNSGVGQVRERENAPSVSMDELDAQLVFF
ncbi:hypothetical protein FOA52_003526 [Chlamydomonas sp. UWO 241]|nr:hypothetical protein FOA52_003526 [Chlamydomonas sp. UWO 241]